MENYGINYQSLHNIKTLAQRDPKLALRKLASEFESLIWYEILKGLDRTTFKSGLFPETLDKKIFQEYFLQEVARRVSGRPGGLGEYLYRHLIKSYNFKERLSGAEK